ncbi:hypothetical protein [Tenacibaculum sp. 190130A14a]|uniref:hypothetical protein n=1 Tax=Tenacibaculum polynesiense TaxID=3137857 RepID=UPI0032B2E714
MKVDLKHLSKRRFKVRENIQKFLFLPIIHRGKLHWFTDVLIEKSFNGHKMKIINIQRIRKAENI